MLDQCVQALDLLIFGSIVDGAFTVLIQRQFGTVAQQPSHCGQVSTGSGKVKRSGTIAVTEIRIDTLIFDLREKFKLKHDIKIKTSERLSAFNWLASVWKSVSKPDVKLAATDPRPSFSRKLQQLASGPKRSAAASTTAHHQPKRR